jgi:hypothetical protein
VFAEFRRVLRPGGHLMLAFQAGDEINHCDEGFGHKLSLDFRRQQPDRIAALLAGAGFEMVVRLIREPRDYAGGVETTSQAYLVARKPLTP